MSNRGSLGAELVRAWTGASVVANMLNPEPAHDGTLCCVLIVKDTVGDVCASKVLHVHPTREELYETLENPGNGGMFS